MGFLDRLAVSSLPLIPGPLMRAVADCYIAGETLEEALAAIERNRARGFGGVLDLLGEEIDTEAGAWRVAGEYCRSATLLHARGLDAYVSIKPTHVGLRIAEDLAHGCFDRVARHTAPLGQIVRVEMEDRTTTDATLRIFARLRRDHDNVGVVLQSRLFRTPADVDTLAPGFVSVRMVKGIYLEPAAVAHVDRAAISDAFVAASRRLFQRGAHVAFGTHDGPLAARLIALVRELAVPADRYEFEVLMGIQPRLWDEWREAGHRVRVYVPYGPEWRAYSTRRLRKNPEIFRHVARQLLGRIAGK
ncbi:MAG: proline dehydrogenase family protein [Planctomycetota bacterium]